MIYGIQDNTLTMYGTIWDYDGQNFIYYLNSLEKQYSEITIRLHTYGGDVFAGNLMCNAIERSKADITIIIDGLAASMGAVFILSGKKVKIVNNGYVMIHAPSSGSFGNAKDHESSAKLLRHIEENFIDKLMARTGKSRAEVSKWLESDTWLSAKEALAYGLVSEIIPASVSTIYQTFQPDDMGETEVFNMYASALLNTVSKPAVTAFLETQQFQPQSQNQLIFNDNMKQLIISAFGLQAVNAQSSDTAVLEAVQGQITDLKNQLQKEKDERNTAEAKLKSYEDSRINSLIENASKVLNKPFTEEERKTYETIGATSGVEALEMVFRNVNKPQTPGISAIIQAGASGSISAGRDSWDFAKWQKEDPKGLEKLATQDPEKFKQLFNAKYNN